MSALIIFALSMFVYLVGLPLVSKARSLILERFIQLGYPFHLRKKDWGIYALAMLFTTRQVDHRGWLCWISPYSNRYSAFDYRGGTGPSPEKKRLDYATYWRQFHDTWGVAFWPVVLAVNLAVIAPFWGLVEGYRALRRWATGF